MIFKSLLRHSYLTSLNKVVSVRRRFPTDVKHWKSREYDDSRETSDLRDEVYSQNASIIHVITSKKIGFFFP